MTPEEDQGAALFRAVKRAMLEMPHALDDALSYYDLPPVAQRHLVALAGPLVEQGIEQGRAQTLEKLRRHLIANVGHDAAIAVAMGLDVATLPTAAIDIQE